MYDYNLFYSRRNILFNTKHIKMKRKEDEVTVLTGQFVSQLIYQSSRLQNDDFEQVTNEMLKLIDSYRQKVKKLKNYH